MKHIAWDFMMLADLGLLVGQKTIKTLCNRRVSFTEAVGHKHASNCPNCRAEVDRKIASTAECIKALALCSYAHEDTIKNLTIGAIRFAVEQEQTPEERLLRVVFQE